jgi:hypothetical protein
MIEMNNKPQTISAMDVRMASLSLETAMMKVVG